MSDSSRRNNLDALRWFLAAACVILGHSWELSGNGKLRIPFVPDLGSLAVQAFFVLSGWLILKSRADSDSVWEFALRRFARIWPAFAVATLFGGAILLVCGGWLDLPLLVGQAVTLGPYRETGFASNPLTPLNGSLWTIRYEEGCYIGLAVLFALGFYKNRNVVLGATLALMIVGNAVGFRLVDPGPYRAALWLGTSYMIGSCAYLWRERIKWSLWVTLGLIAAHVATAGPHGSPFYGFVPAYAAIYFGIYAKPVFSGWIKHTGDLSYGSYLYAFPVGQALVYFGCRNPLLLFALTLALTTPLAMLSWRYVESPLKKWARSIRIASSSSRSGSDGSALPQQA